VGEHSGVTFEHPVTVRWKDTDALGHVNHAVFLTYLEEGRDAFYLHITRSDPVYVVVRLEVDLRTEVFHQDKQVLVRIEVEKLGTTSLTTGETILNAAGLVVAQARVVTVRWDQHARKPVPWTDDERSRLLP
jgi:acyl-CoA thioester hydrolase